MGSNSLLDNGIFDKGIFKVVAWTICLTGLVACGSEPSNSEEAALEDIDTVEQAISVVDADLSTEIWASGFGQGTSMSIAPNGWVFVVEQNGQINAIDPSGSHGRTQIHDIPGPDSGSNTLSRDTGACCYERGAIGIEVDPNYMSNGYFWVAWTRGDGGSGDRNVITRFQVDDVNAPNGVVGSGNDVIVLSSLSSAQNHNGGAIHFHDGYLFHSAGDNAAGNSNTTNFGNTHGKILRYNLDGSIPSDNPFGSSNPIWANGLRNPFTFDIHDDGTMFVNDVGNGSNEEINVVVEGGDYCYSGRTGCTGPRYSYPKGALAGGCAIAGGVFYDPPQPTLGSQYQDKYFFGDYCAEIIRTINKTGSTNLATFATSAGSGLVDLDVAPDGSLFWLSRNSGGELGRIYNPSAACTSDSQCDDDNSCTADSCVNGACQYADSGTCSAIYLEAECPTTAQGAYQTSQTSQSGFSGSGHLTSTANTTADPFNGTSVDRATYAFNVPAGSYNVYFRIDTGGSTSDDSWYFSMGAESWVTENNHGGLGDGWHWVLASGGSRTLSGSTTIEIANRENGLSMDKIALVPVGQSAPAGTLGDAENCGGACGDGTCGSGETCANCAVDCGPCDVCGDGTCGASETCSSCAADCGECPSSSELYLEAECADETQGAYGTTLTSQAAYSGDGHLTSNGHTTANPFNGSSVDFATYGFDVPPGEYNLYFRVDSDASSGSDSWYFRLDGGSWTTENGHYANGSGWFWVHGAGGARTLGGSHTLEVANRESGLSMDKIAVLPVGEPAPSGLGGVATNCGPLPACGDFVCNADETCGSCPYDCNVCPGGELIDATFDGGSEEFVYVDDAFGTSTPSGASGNVGNGNVRVTLGQAPGSGANSGAWAAGFSASGLVNVSLDYDIDQSQPFEAPECAEVRVAIDGVLYGAGTDDFVVRLCGGGAAAGTFSFMAGPLAAGSHTLEVGAYLNGNSAADEVVLLDIDNVQVNGESLGLDTRPANPTCVAGDSSASKPVLLSHHPCISAVQNPPVMVPGVIPYSINQAFWSDSAQKTRYFALPDGASFDVRADGDFDLPPGAVTIKHFQWGGPSGPFFETRFFVRYDDGTHEGYTYKWNDAEDEATLVDSVLGDQKTLPGGHVWTYPTTADCAFCHSSAAGHSLGLETRQLNVEQLYPSTGRVANQYETLEGIGVLSGGPGPLPPLPDVDTAGVDTLMLAKAYLHVNCANCHRPGGPGQGLVDFRYDVPFADMNACNVESQADAYPGLDHVEPGDHLNSVVWLRMSQRDANFMPPIASTLPDAAGAALLQGWIDGLSGCP